MTDSIMNTKNFSEAKTLRDLTVSGEQIKLLEFEEIPLSDLELIVGGSKLLLSKGLVKEYDRREVYCKIKHVCVDARERFIPNQ